jgi:hypothetical protein
MMLVPMSDELPSKVLGALPRTRPHRRSDKRAAPAGNPVGGDLPLTADPAARGPSPPPGAHPPAADPPGSVAARKPLPAGANVLGTAVQAAAELAEIGLSVSARALRGALSRLPRP